VKAEVSKGRSLCAPKGCRFTESNHPNMRHPKAVAQRLSPKNGGPKVPAWRQCPKTKIRRPRSTDPHKGSCCSSRSVVREPHPERSHSTIASLRGSFPKSPQTRRCTAITVRSNQSRHTHGLNPLDASTGLPACPNRGRTRGPFLLTGALHPEGHAAPFAKFW